MDFTLQSHRVRSEGIKGRGDKTNKEYRSSEEYTKEIGPQG